MVVIWWLWVAWGQRVLERQQIRKAVIIENRRRTGCFFNFQERDDEVDSGGDVGGCGMHGDKETLRVCVRKASNPKSRREIHHHRKPSGNRLFFFNIQVDMVMVMLVVVGCMGTKQHYRVCV